MPPRRVLALTFTNKAARELRERLTGVLGPAAADAMTMGTFHSLVRVSPNPNPNPNSNPNPNPNPNPDPNPDPNQCLAMLRRDIARLQPELPYRPGFAMYDADDAVKVVREIMTETGVVPPKQPAAAAKKARGWTPWQVQSAISAAKNANVSAASYARLHGASPLVAATFARYAAAVLTLILILTLQP